MTDDARPVRRRALFALAVAGLVVVAGAGVYGLILNAHRSTSSVETRADGPTLYQALAEVNGSVNNTVGGPWSLFSVYGIAAQIPFSPNVIGYPTNNHTINNCGAVFNGLTLWNGTIPLFNGTFNSGTAPFWQFAYFSNTSESILLATDTLGSVEVFAPQPYPGPCNAWYDLGSNPSYWYIPPSLYPADSPAAAQSAWGGSVSGWIQENEPMVQIFTIGPGVFDGLGDVSGYGVYFERCGLVGVTGDAEPLVQVGEDLQGQSGEVFNLSHNCALPRDDVAVPQVDGIYDLVWQSPEVSSSGPTQWISAQFQVAFAYPNGTLTRNYDGWGLANWMTALNVSNASGSELPVGAPGCPAWIANVSECAANSTGWYAVDTSSHGEWINAYGALANGTVGWTEPVTDLASLQHLVIVTPASWDLSSDRLSVNSTVSTSAVVGSTTL